MNVLVVEDDTFYSRVIGEMLGDREITVTLFATAHEAVSADVSSYDAAIVDVMLPNDPAVSGITNEESRGGYRTGVCVARRLLKRNPALRVILLTSGVADTDAESWARDHAADFIRKDEGIGGLMRALDRVGVTGVKKSPLSLIVHGHDEVALLQLKNYIQNTLKWSEPIVLREKPSCGKTIIEKFEELADKIDCVFVLLTADDATVSNGTNDQKRRSRQNVIFELGFFYGSLGRQSGRVFLLHGGAIELPSDISGIVWVDITGGIPAAGEDIRREIDALFGGR